MIWLTEIKKPDPLTGEIKSWCGPRIEANSWVDANWEARKIKHCHILGILEAEIDYEPMTKPCQN